MFWRVQTAWSQGIHPTFMGLEEHLAERDVARLLGSWIVKNLVQVSQHYSGGRGHADYGIQASMAAAGIASLLNHGNVWEAYDMWHQFLDKFEGEFDFPTWLVTGTVIVEAPEGHGPQVRKRFIKEEDFPEEMPPSIGFRGQCPPTLGADPEEAAEEVIDPQLNLLMQHPAFIEVLNRAQQLREAGEESAADAYMKTYYEGAVKALTKDPSLMAAIVESADLRERGRIEEAERKTEEVWEKFVKHLTTGGQRRRWRIWLETDPEVLSEASIHILEEDAKSHVKRVLEGILQRAKFQIEVWQGRFSTQHEDYYFQILNATEEAEKLLGEGRVWDALAWWRQFQDYDEWYGAERAGQEPPPPIGLLTGSIRVEIT